MPQWGVNPQLTHSSWIHGAGSLCHALRLPPRCSVPGGGHGASTGLGRQAGSSQAGSSQAGTAARARQFQGVSSGVFLSRPVTWLTLCPAGELIVYRQGRWQRCSA